MKELFIVEGKSAASSIRQAMHKPSQSVVAIQGKLINAAKATPAKVMANQPCQKILETLACGIKNNCDSRQLIYSRILILMDPDIDGIHARLLLLTFFEHYLKPLIDSGLVSVIIPPLLRIAEPQAVQYQYAWSEQEYTQLLNQKATQNNIEITRFKSVTQFSAAECIQLLLHPDSRKQIDLLRNNLNN